jgi:mono/diheme cytochrome c family protein
MRNEDSILFSAIITAGLTLLLSTSAQGADSGRGGLLYENHCLSCHESTVHVRDNHKVNSIDEIRAQVIRWAKNQMLEWGPAEIDDVVDYLDEHFYHFGRTQD